MGLISFLVFSEFQNENFFTPKNQYSIGTGIPSLIQVSAARRLFPNFELNGSFGGFYVPFGNKTSLGYVGAEVSALGYVNDRFIFGLGFGVNSLFLSVGLEASSTLEKDKASISLGSFYAAPKIGIQFFNQTSILQIFLAYHLPMIPYASGGASTVNPNPLFEQSFENEFKEVGQFFGKIPYPTLSIVWKFDFENKVNLAKN